MARLSDSFGAISTPSSIGRIKALSVLKSPPRITPYFGERLRLIRSVRLPTTISNTSGKILLQLNLPTTISNTSGKILLQLNLPKSTFSQSGKFSPKFDKLITPVISSGQGKILPISVRLPSTIYNLQGKLFTQSARLPNTISNTSGKILPISVRLPSTIYNLQGKLFTQSARLPNTISNTSGKFSPKFAKLNDLVIPSAFGKVLPISARLPNTISNTFGKVLPKPAGLCATPDTRSLFKQSNYIPDNNYDFSVAVTGQNLDSSIRRYTVDSIFTENNPSESYLWNKQSSVSSSIKTLYFANQGRIRFEVGDKVRIRNVNNSYLELVVVTSSTFNSISYSSNNLIPEISGTFIDSGTTLYKFETYNIQTATTSAINLFTSIIAPGKRGVSTAAPLILVPDLRRLPSKLSNITTLKNDGNPLSSYKPGQLKPFKTSVISVPDFRSVSKVTFGRPTYTEIIDLRKLPNKLSNITKLKNDGDRLSTYALGSYTFGKVQKFKTPFVAPAVDLRSTLYYGRVTIKLKNDADLLPTYKLGKVKQFKTQFIAPVIDSRSTMYLGRMMIPLKGLSYNTQLNLLAKKAIVLKRADDNLKNVESLNKRLFKLNADGTVLSVSMMKKATQSLNGLVDDFRVSRSNYVTKYKFTPLSEVKFASIPSKILISLKDIPISYKAQTIQKRYAIVTSPLYNVRTDFLRKGFVVKELPNNIRKINNLTIPIKGITFPYYKISNIASNIFQSTVSTNIAPKNARENLYYVNLAPGLRSRSVYNTTSSYANIGNQYLPANITASITQSSVSTTTSPKNARENLYYATLAPGLRSNVLYNRTSSYAVLNVNSDIANVSSNTSQSSVSTTTSPKNARENLYYSILAPGLRSNAVYNTTSSYANIGNQYLPANITASIAQSSVSTNIAPTNARENLYYSILIPGLRNNAMYSKTSSYASIDSIQIRNVNVFQIKSFYRDLPLQFRTEKLSLYSPLDNLNISETSIQITGQNLDSSISRYNTDLVFTENNPSESYLWNKSTISSSIKTLYFANQSNQKFFTGDVVKIRNSNSGYVDYAYVVSATNNSITYTGSNLIPEISGTFIESGTTIYSKLLSTTIGPKALRNFNISVATPGKNATKSFGYGQYSAASTLEVVSPYSVKKQVPSFSKGDVLLDLASKIRSINTLKSDVNLFDIDSINIQKIRNIKQFDLPLDYAVSKLHSISRFKGLPSSFIVNNMKRYDPDSSGMPSDFTLAIIDQSLNQFSNYYSNTETIFIENTPTDGYIWGTINRTPSTAQPTTKTLYFTNQQRFIFSAGEKVRVRNATTGRSTLETVVECTYDSVTISLPSIPINEITNTFIDSGFTAYGQNFVRTTLMPTNAREVFYYARMAKGFRSTNKYSQTTSYADTPSLNNTTFKLPYTYTIPKAILRPAYTSNYQNIDFVARFKTGDFKRGSNGTIDPAVAKKPPIQFWS